MKHFQKFAAAFVLLMIFSSSASACPLCRAQVESGIFDGNFLGNFFMMLSPVILITAIGLGLYYADKISDRLKNGVKRWLV